MTANEVYAKVSAFVTDNLAKLPDVIAQIADAAEYVGTNALVVSHTLKGVNQTFVTVETDHDLDHEDDDTEVEPEPEPEPAPAPAPSEPLPGLKA